MRIQQYFCVIGVQTAAICGFNLPAVPAMAVPFTSATVTANTGGTAGIYSDTSFVTTPGESSSASVSVGANTVGSDGRTPMHRPLPSRILERWVSPEAVTA